MKKVSIIDVAKRADVSVSTVSLVLRQKGKISAATIARVQDAIAELGYVHNVAAANLRASTSNLIGLIVRDFNDPFSTRVTASIIQALEAQGFMVLVTQPPDEAQQLAQSLLAFTRQGVAGVIYLAVDATRDSLPQALADTQLPLVAVSQTPLHGPCDLVMRDNRQAASLATRYLLERGHRTIAYVGGSQTSLIRQQRLLGFRSMLNQYGISWRDELAPACDEETHAVSLATRRLLERNSPVTALLCHSPHAIIGCIEGIHQMGRTVGKDIFLTQQVSLIGFEDMLHINLTSPSISWVSSASEETGQQAAALIIRKINQPTLAAQRITLSGQLMPGDSA